SGHGTPMDHWSRALPDIAVMAPVFTYDRPGVGKSPALDYEPTAENVANNLVNVLGRAGIPPPYILVGHSLGGAYVRGFTNYYPEYLSGLVIIDPADFTERLTDRPAYYTGLGLAPGEVDSLINFFVARRERRHADSPDPIRREGEVLEAMRRNDFTSLNATPLPNIPVHFLVGGRFDLPSKFHSKTYNDEQLFRTKISRRVTRWLDLVQQVDKGMLFYAGQAGHFVHHDQPELLVSSIEIILKELKK
ncbi:MAG: alpha/beta hydrolase, partial [Bacteroidota bacterium]